MKRTNVMSIRWTADEWKIIRRAARQAKLSASAWVRARALDSTQLDAFERPRPTDAEIIDYLARVNAANARAEDVLRHAMATATPYIPSHDTSATPRAESTFQPNRRKKR